MWSPAVLVLICALVHALFLHLSKRKQLSYKENNDLRSLSSMDDSIFVCVVSYKDTRWLGAVRDMFDSAKIKDRVFVGVVEYVEDTDETMADAVPSDIRNRVRVLTLSHKMAHTLRGAREDGVKELYGEEKYVLFSRSAVFCDSWDSILVGYMKGIPDGVISCELTDESKSTFTAIDKIERGIPVTIQKELYHRKGTDAVPALMWSPDFSFCAHEYSKYMYSDENAFGVSSVLFHKGIRMYHPTRCVASRTEHPRGVRVSTRIKVKPYLLNNFAAHIGVDLESGEIDANARCGLTSEGSPAECISKYGSVTNARIAMQKHGGQLAD